MATDNSHSLWAGDKEHILNATLKIHDLVSVRKQGSDPNPLKVNRTISVLAGSPKPTRFSCILSFALLLQSAKRL